MLNSGRCFCLFRRASDIYSLRQPGLVLQPGGNPIHWPVDRYFTEGKRTAVFLGEEVVKYHKTLTTYINGLLQTGFEICELIEPQPDEKLLDTIPGMKDELRRPIVLLISAKKKVRPQSNEIQGIEK